MLIPSIDLKGGRVVQLIQGDRLAIESDDVFLWVRRFSWSPAVQLIDLDAAIGVGTNDTLVRQIAAQISCRVGGGVRSVERARELVEAGARKVILGSALFSRGRPNLSFAAEAADAIGHERVIAAVDARGGRVVIHGWRTTLPLTPFEAIRALEPYCGEFLFTNVDREGLLQGADLDAVRAIREATSRLVTAAGGITTVQEVEALSAMGVDAVVGMAIYTGRLGLGQDRA